MAENHNHHLQEEEIMKPIVKKEVAVVMVPLLGQGHMMPLLQLGCTLVSTYDGLSIHYLSIASQNEQIRARANALNPDNIALINFHDLPTPPGTGVQFYWNCCTLLREPVASFLKDMPAKARRVVVLYDPTMSCNVQDGPSIPNVECYTFCVISAFEVLCNFMNPTLGIPIPLEPQLLEKLPSRDACYGDIGAQMVDFQLQYGGIKVGEIYNTSKVIEGPYIDEIAKYTGSQNQKAWAIGPIFQLAAGDRILYDKTNVCLDWLNKQPPKSVIYVSFGTNTTFTAAEIKELAHGLELSKQKFIWVLRHADYTAATTQHELPEGFEERVLNSGMGLVVNDWAPQPEILAHPSTGGFMSHCGWNSCLESITVGVPIAAWPMQCDQPKHAFLVTEILKIGVIVREWDKRDELVTAYTIANAITRLMASEEGEAIHKRAKELGEAVRKSTEEGGVSRKELDSFVEHIKR